MTDNGGLVALSGLLTLAVAAVLAPVPEIAFILQVATLVGAIGTLVGLFLERRDLLDDWSKSAAWGGSIGLLIGFTLVVGSRIGVI